MNFLFRWDITQLLLRIPNIGAVLDLTNTARYYNPKVSNVVKNKLLPFDPHISMSTLSFASNSRRR